MKNKNVWRKCRKENPNTNGKLYEEKGNLDNPSQIDRTLKYFL